MKISRRALITGSVCLGAGFLGLHNQLDHGYNFEVPASPETGLVDPVPLKAMGRFRHEAVAVDPRSGIVFQTEDTSDSLIYRYIPTLPGQLAKGGKLHALGIKGQPSVDTRNWIETGEPSILPGHPMNVQWFDLTQVESPQDVLRFQEYYKGAACFARGEGMWHGNGEIYFACTNGGANKSGQIFRYRPSPYEGEPGEMNTPGRLELYLEPNNTDLLEHADNLTVAPWGDLIICEDGRNNQFVRGVTSAGEIYTLARNCFNHCEFTGACFAPNHPTLFINIQKPGITLAITGPWFQS